MGLFGRKKVSVTVFGKKNFLDQRDGRYDKQVSKNLKAEAKKERKLVLQAHTTAELRGYIEHRYQVEELPKEDERYKEAYMSVKAALLFTYRPDLLRTPTAKEPNHPPKSDDDPDYVLYRETEDRRYREAIMVSPSEFPLHLHVYNIPLMQGETPIAWVEFYIESTYQYLAYKVIRLEYEDHYMITDTVRDVIMYFGASEKDRKEENERYLQFLRMQK